MIMKYARHVSRAQAIQQQNGKRLDVWEAGQKNMLVKETARTCKKYLYVSRRDNLDIIGSRHSKAYFSKGNFG